MSCHRAPGIPPSHIGKGQRPPPPELAKEIYPWLDAELFWIIDNGITKTGMPALGPAHTEAELWSLVAFVKQLPQMTAERYQSFRKHDLEGHSH